MDRVSLFAAGAALFLATSTPAHAQRPGPMQPGILRVCADPDNLPNSNKAGEGFENKLAELLAATWNSKLEYVWWAAPRGMMRMLNGTYCDIWLQIPAGFDLSGVTRPYFRTSYTIVRRQDGPDVTSLDDPRLKTLKIGVHLFAADGENSPPAMALSAHGVVGNLVGFSTTYSGGLDRPVDIIQAVIDRKIDIALVWGPIGGYWTRKLGADLVLTPIENDSLTRLPMAYSMGMAVRRRDRELKDSLERFMTAKRPEILALLKEFGVPLLPLPADTAR
ncbi:MAG: quinoprotein dehydrogenase-associated putative ABC transporter substrate-binding protein [Gemmatimonadota bacterium]|nr:quinoprotein dehydrogenase-associated putative ABC transporter substrate-binding protein [Gemmatimonadota bacterium]